MIIPIDNQGFWGSHAKVAQSQLQAAHEKWFTHAHNLNLELHKLIPLIKPHKSAAQDMLVAVLFTRALTLYQSSLLLAMNGLPEECKIILRSLIELVIYLRAIHSDIKFAEDFTLKHERERLRLNKLIIRSPFLKGNFDQAKVEEAKSRILESLSDRLPGYSLEEYAEAAEMLAVLHTAYKDFCGSVHSGIYDLQVHLNGTSPDTVTEIRYGISDENVDHLLLVATELMLSCVPALKERFKLPQAPELEKICNYHQILGKEETEKMSLASHPIS